MLSIRNNFIVCFGTGTMQSVKHNFLRKLLLWIEFGGNLLWNLQAVVLCSVVLYMYMQVCAFTGLEHWTDIYIFTFTHVLGG